MKNYLHAEVIDGCLYVYVADQTFDNDEVDYDQMANECLMNSNHVVVCLEKLMKDIRKRKEKELEVKLEKELVKLKDKKKKKKVKK